MTGETPIRAAQRLSDAMEQLQAEAARLNTYASRNRHWIMALAFSLALDLVLTVLFVVNAVAIDHNHATLSQVQQASVTACQQSNQLRTEQKSLWFYLISISIPPPKGTPAYAEDMKLLGELKAHINKDFAPQNCAAYRHR